jgi:hypothetical protein
MLLLHVYQCFFFNPGFGLNRCQTPFQGENGRRDKISLPNFVGRKFSVAGLPTCRYISIAMSERIALLSLIHSTPRSRRWLWWLGALHGRFALYIVHCCVRWARHRVGCVAQHSVQGTVLGVQHCKTRHQVWWALHWCTALH